MIANSKGVNRPSSRCVALEAAYRVLMHEFTVDFDNKTGPDCKSLLQGQGSSLWRRIPNRQPRRPPLCEDHVVRYLTIEIPVELWQRVDGCVDNSMAVDVVDGVMESVIAGSCVRDAGWRASAEYGDECDSLGWPPREHLLGITLRLAHWEWVLSQLDRWAPCVTDDLVEDDSVRAIIRAALAAT